MTEIENKKYHGSLMYRTWLYFLGMTAIILLIFWISEVVFFRAFYRVNQENTLDKSARTVFNSFNGTPSESYQATVKDISASNSLAIVLFTTRSGAPLNEASSGDIMLVLYQDPLDRQQNLNEQVAIDETFVNTVTQAPGELFSYRANPRGDSYTYIIGGSKTIGEQTVYFYMASPVLPVNSMMLPFTNQFIIVTCICIIISVFLSLVFAVRITRPITEFARTAKLLGKGEKVTFKGGGYEEYDQLAKALNYSTEELEKTEKMRRDFLANISHDLRTPLTMVKAYAEMIRDISGTSEQKRNEHCKVIIDEVDRLTLLVNDLLDLSKIQAGTRKPETTRVNLTSVVRTVMERFSVYAERDGYVFDLDIDEQCVIIADERMIEQICYNLIGNAISYTGVDKKVSVSVKKTDGSVRVRIADTGKGIAPSEREKVWDRYYRASQAKRAVVGSGIGLSIVKGLLEAHDAKFGIDSVVNHGSTFWFELPLVIEQE